MSDPQQRIILLGPQPEYRSLQTALVRLRAERSIALISAGWEEDELEDSEIRDSLPVAIVNLELFGRSEELFHVDPELIGHLRDRQDQLRHLRDIYRMRIDYGLQIVEELNNWKRSHLDLSHELESSIEAVRKLDQEYFDRTSQICDYYDQLLNTWQRPQVQRHREKLRDQLKDCQAIVISGGNVGITLNRLRIFGVLELRPDLPIVAWSGGGMALANEIVFFHDSPPQGKGNAEIFRAGLGLLNGVVPLPDAESRLDLANKKRVEVFAKRFHRSRCIALDEQSIVEFRDGKCCASERANLLGQDGTLLGYQHA